MRVKVSGAPGYADFGGKIVPGLHRYSIGDGCPVVSVVIPDGSTDAVVIPAEHITDVEDPIVTINSCGTANDHTPEWNVSMTSPDGRTGVTIRKCGPCALAMLDTPAVQTLGRTVHLKKIGN
jgi:hypothetical protein